MGLAVLSREAEHGERLNGLPEPHVVGETAAEPQAPEGEQPAHPALLVGAEDRPQSGVSGRCGRRRGVPERPELLPEPGTGDHVRPVGGLRIFDLAGRFREVDPGEEPHRLPQRDPERLGVRLRLLPGAEHLPEFLRVHLDPFPADERQSFGSTEEFCALGLAERFAVESEREVEIEQGVHPQP